MLRLFLALAPSALAPAAAQAQDLDRRAAEIVAALRALALASTDQAASSGQ
jgi:hypothetical protein